jgi:two-component system OmpR family response regulator/two-component system response regulator CpxR
MAREDRLKAVFIGEDPRSTELAAMSFRLRWPDVVPLISTSAIGGLELVDRESPDVILLHPGFPDMHLSQVIEEIRQITNVPLLVLSYEGDEKEMVTALELGADDYVNLPCDLTELIARIWALLRRAGMRTASDTEGPLSSGGLLINPATYEVFLENHRITLTSTEFRLLHLLVRNRGTVVTRHTLEQTLWGEHVDSYGLVKKYIQRLRKKLGDNARDPSWIASIHGVGYRFIGPRSAPVAAERYYTK